MVNFSLEGKVALVTGASYGIGFALATAFARQGAKIVFNDIKQELVDKGLAAYKEEGIDAKGYVCDVTNEEQVNAMVAQIEKEVGVIDILSLIHISRNADHRHDDRRRRRRSLRQVRQGDGTPLPGRPGDRPAGQGGRPQGIPLRTPPRLSLIHIFVAIRRNSSSRNIRSVIDDAENDFSTFDPCLIAIARYF